MGSKTRLSSYCTKRANNGVNLVTSRKINTRLARPINNNVTIFVFNNECPVQTGAFSGSRPRSRSSCDPNNFAPCKRGKSHLSKTLLLTEKTNV